MAATDDDRFAADLAAALQGADVPQSFLDAGRAAFAWRGVDAELAELRLDTLTAGAGSLRGDGPAAPRALSFAAGDLSIEIELHPDAVRGQLVPPTAGTVTLHRINAAEVGAAEQHATIDDLGWFVLSPAPRERFQLHVRTSTGRAALTGWITP